MIKKLLFASMLTSFCVLSTMAQNAPYDIFIGTTNNLYFAWAKNRLSSPAAPNCKDANGDCIDKTTGTCQLVNGNPQNCDINGAPLDDNDGPRAGFFWNNTLDSVGAITTFGPYEGADHMEFNYNTDAWWAVGQFNFNPGYQTVPPKDFSGYTHLKLHWKGYSAANPGNNLTFSLTDTNGNSGPNVIVADNSNQVTYQEKIVPLKSFLGFGGYTTLTDLTTIFSLNFSVGDGASTWWQTGGVTEGAFYIDAIQLFDWLAVDAGGVSVFHSDTIDFGTTPQGTPTATTTFTITNAGESDLTLSGSPNKITISGDAADFTVVQSGLSSPIAPAGSTSFTVTFNPSSNGAKTAILSIENDFSPSGNYVIVLTGSTTFVPQPEISVKAGSTSVASGANFGFGSLNTGANSTVTFTITNLGNTDLSLTGTPKIAVSGAADFTVNEAATTSPVAPGGGTTTFTVTFAPSSAGAKSATITIANDDPDEGSYVINLTGSATVPGPEINVKAGSTSVASGANFGFGSLTTGANSTVTFTIENLGNTDLNLTGTPKVVVSGAADFTVNATATFSPVASTSSTTFTVTFSPTSAGAKSAAITIANNDTDEGVYTINLTGTATVVLAPEINVRVGPTSVASAGSFGFGSVNTGANSTVTFTIENLGNSILNLSQFTSMGTTSDFTVSLSGTSWSIAGSGSTTFTITFAPSSIGVRSATITISNNDANEGSYVINLTGTGTIPEINIMQGSSNIASFETYNFGNSNIGVATSPVTFLIESLGSGVLNLTGTPKVFLFGTNPTDFTINQSGTPSTIAGGSSTTFTVTFNPSSAGVKSAVITITNNDADEGSYLINLTGTGTAATGLFGSTSKSFEALIVPNPSNGIYNINTGEKIDEVIVSDCMGNILLNNSDSQIDLSNRPSGVYFLTIISGEKRFFGKLLKN